MLPAMRVVDALFRLLVVLALAFAAPALAFAPASASAAIHHQAVAPGQAAQDEASAHAMHAVAAPASGIHDCGDAAPSPVSHHATPDCLICCCALAAPLVAPDVARAVTRIAPPERPMAFDSLNRPPPAPPPRA